MQGGQDALMNQLYGQNLGFQNNYNMGSGIDFGTYDQAANNYQNLFNGIANGSFGVGQGFNGLGPSSSSGGYSYTGNNPTDPQAEAQYVQYLSQQPGADPTLASDPNYWIGKINDTGGLTQDNIGYWNNKSLLGGGNGGGGNSALGSAQAGFQNFADTGGFSPQDIQDLRARALAPTRAVYANAMSNLNQNRQLQQFSPNYAAATAKLSRDLGYGLSDANVNADASIAQMIQSGKLAGLQGLTGIAGLNEQGQVANLNALLGANNGLTGLYGTTPGMANTYGNQLLNSSGQLVSGQGLQNQTGLGLINAQLGESQVPGDFSQAMSNIAAPLKLAGGFLSGFGGLGNIFGGGSTGFNPGAMTSSGLGFGNSSTYYGLQ